MARPLSPPTSAFPPFHPVLTYRLSLDFILIGLKPASDLVYSPSDPHHPIRAMSMLLQHLLGGSNPTDLTDEQAEDLRALAIKIAPFPPSTPPTDHDTAWTFTPDTSNLLTPREASKLPESWFETGIRLESPNFGISDYHFSWREQLHHILRVLHENFNGAERNFPFRLLVNETCAYRVRVDVAASAGEDDGGADAVQTISGVWQLLTGFERLWAEMSTVSRLARTYAPSVFFRRQQAGIRPLQWCNLINRSAGCGVDGLEELISVFEASGRESERAPALVFGLGGREKRAFIEFRQRRGTLDYSEAVAWLDIIASLVDAVRQRTDLQDLLRKHVGDAGYTLDELFREIGTQSCTQKYYRRHLDRENGTARAEMAEGMLVATGEAAEVVKRVEKERWYDRRADRLEKFIKKYERAGGFGILDGKDKMKLEEESECDRKMRELYGLLRCEHLDPLHSNI